MYYVYILKSLKDGRYYYGSTEDLEFRISTHNKGQVRSTRHRRPLVLHHVEMFPTRRAALVWERFFKRPAGWAYLKRRGII